jgi:ACT domain-containing protein
VERTRRKHNPEEILTKLRQVDVMTSQRRSLGEAVRTIGIAEAIYYRWRNEYDGLKLD